MPAWRGRFLRHYADAVRTCGGLSRPRALALAGFALRGLPPGATCRVTVSQRRMCMPAKADCGVGSACGECAGALPGASKGHASEGCAAPVPAASAAWAAPHAAPVASVQVVADAGGCTGACLQDCVVRGEVKVLVRSVWLSLSWLACRNVDAASPFRVCHVLCHIASQPWDSSICLH